MGERSLEQEMLHGSADLVMGMGLFVAVIWRLKEGSGRLHLQTGKSMLLLRWDLRVEKANLLFWRF